MTIVIKKPNKAISAVLRFIFGIKTKNCKE